MVITLNPQNSLHYPKSGIATDAAHSVQQRKTLYRAIDLKSGRQLFLVDLSFQTVNIGEFLAVVHAIKYIIENDYLPQLIYTDSQTALSWIKAKKTASKKLYAELMKAEIFLQAYNEQIKNIQVIHWDKKQWGEIPADFGNK